MDFEVTVLGPWDLKDIVWLETDMVDGCRDEKNAERTQQETARVVLKRICCLRAQLGPLIEMELEGGSCTLWTGGGKEGVRQTLLQPPAMLRLKDQSSVSTLVRKLQRNVSVSV